MRFKLTIIILFIIIYCFSLTNISQNKREIINKQNSNNSHNTIELKKEEKPKKQKKEEPLATIKIPKINLQNKLYNINSKENNVNKNIQIIKESNMPDMDKGNLILAAHNGQSKISYFHNLNKLVPGDEVTINYNNNDYKYHIDNAYNVLKTGKVSIKRDKNKKTITLITCSGENEQLIVIGYQV